MRRTFTLIELLVAISFLLSLITPACGAVIRVWPSAPGPTHDGQSWSTAFLDLPDAVAVATDGDEVWVAQGTYVGGAGTKFNVSFYGGFNGTETERAQRDPTAHPTVIQGTGPDYHSTGGLGTEGNTGPVTVDGFTFEKNAQAFCGAAESTVSNNVFRDGTYGVWVQVSRINYSVTIRNNTFTGFTKIPIYIWVDLPGHVVIEDNVITGNQGVIYTTATSVAYPLPLVTIVRNVITNNVGSPVLITFAAADIANNLFFGNRCLDAGAINLYSASGSIVNNTIVGNSGPAIRLSLSSGYPNVVANNLVAFNSPYGIWGNLPSTTDPVALYNNCVYGNGQDYVYMKDATGFQGNISVDPQIVSFAGRDFHLAPTSPLIDAGDDAFVHSGDTDLDGKPRIQGAHVDIGCYELGGSLFTMGDAAGALRLWAGLSAGTPELTARLNADGKGGVDLMDTIRLLRKATGLDANP